MDDQQRARELLCQFCDLDRADYYDGLRINAGEAAEAITAALRAAPEVVRIPAADGLDPITVYADDLGEGRGRLTVCCYADSWSHTCSWGAMGGSLHGFVAGLHPHYLADNLIWPNAATTKRHQRKYVEQIAAAVIAAFAARPQGVE